jgi:hypothetical protein
MKRHNRMERRRAPLALRAVDAAGRALETLGWSIAALDEGRLCAAARRKSGLSEFGDVEGLRRALDARQRIPSGRIFDVSYRRLTDDPIGVLRELYDHLGYRYSDEFENRVRTWLRQHPAPRRGERYYDLEQLGLDRASVERSFAFYSQLPAVGADSRQ